MGLTVNFCSGIATKCLIKAGMPQCPQTHTLYWLGCCRLFPPARVVSSSQNLAIQLVSMSCHYVRGKELHVNTFDFLNTQDHQINNNSNKKAHCHFHPGDPSEWGPLVGS